MQYYSVSTTTAYNGLPCKENTLIKEKRTIAYRNLPPQIYIFREHLQSLFRMYLTQKCIWKYTLLAKYKHYKYMTKLLLELII